jgi:release factor glutamine methyltransferase
MREIQLMGLPRLESQMLVLMSLGHDPGDRAWLISHDENLIDEAVQSRLKALTERRLAGEPMAYICGHKHFHKLRLLVDARVLDPRDDTETLVDWALNLDLPSSARVLDLGTGSGAIALALAQARPHWQISGGDASADALAVAHHNAAAHSLNVDWVCGDWLTPFAEQSFDLIVSNPPYIPENDPHLLALRHEPLTALASGPDGLQDLRTIIEQAPRHLSDGGWLLLEHGHDQAPRVRRLLAQAGFSQVSSRSDLAGIERCSGGRFPSASFFHP